MRVRVRVMGEGEGVRVRLRAEGEGGGDGEVGGMHVYGHVEGGSLSLEGMLHAGLCGRAMRVHGQSCGGGFTFPGGHAACKFV